VHGLAGVAYEAGVFQLVLVVAVAEVLEPRVAGAYSAMSSCVVPVEQPRLVIDRSSAANVDPEAELRGSTGSGTSCVRSMIE
jgi:hypothetical protein